MRLKRAVTLWNRYRLYVCPIFILLLILPLLLSSHPLHYFTPDLEYVKGKLLYVLEGNIYDDPITGFPNMHPPIYHLFLALPTLIGIPIDTTLLLVTISNVLLIFFFVFRIIQKLFDTDTAVITCLLFPFIIEYMGCGYLFLATALCFSIPFYLAGTYIYLTQKRSLPSTILLSTLWGLAFLITPVYVFLVGFTLLYELIFRRDIKFFYISSLTLAITLIPFFYQMYIISSYNLFATSTFSFWRGLPNLSLLQTIGERIMSPTGHLFTEPLVWSVPLIIIGGFVAIWKLREEKKFSTPTQFVQIALLSFLFTSYHFAPQYATRIYLFLSIFLVAFGVSYLMKSGAKLFVRVGLIALLVIFGTIGFMTPIVEVYSKQNESLEDFPKMRRNFSEAINQIIPQYDFVLARSRTYRIYILPFHLVHSIKAYDSGEYFQLPSEVSKELESDYKKAIRCVDADCLDPICDKYGIEYAIFYGKDTQMPVFSYINKNWKRVYRDRYFAIFKRR